MNKEHMQIVARAASRLTGLVDKPGGRTDCWYVLARVITVMRERGNTKSYKTALDELTRFIGK